MKKIDQRFVFKYEENDINDMDFFLNYPYLIELDLSNYPFYFIPPSITHCQLIERINITNTNFNEPPAILFALPQIRDKPENLVFGKNQHCTKELMMNIVANCATYNQGFLNFKDINGNIGVVSYSPDTTTLDFLLMMYPELKPSLPYIFLVREYKSKGKTYKLYVIPDDVPIILYQYFNSVWSIDIRFLPPILTDELAPYVEKIGEFNLSSVNSFQAILKGKTSNRQVEISISFDSASIRYSPSSYVVCDNRYIHLEYVDGNVLIFFGKQALVLDNDCVENIYPLFKYALPHFYYIKSQNINNIDEMKESFFKLSAKVATTSISAKIGNSFLKRPVKKNI